MIGFGLNWFGRSDRDSLKFSGFCRRPSLRQIRALKRLARKHAQSAASIALDAQESFLLARPQ